MTVAPPLPDTKELLERSEWITGLPGLREESRRWLETLPVERARLARRARRLAMPGPHPHGVASVATAGVRVVDVAVPAAAAELRRRFSRQASVMATGRDPDAERTSIGVRVAIRRAQDAVRDGGPAYVKLGQFLASARGMLPDEVVDAFQWCSDEAEPLPFAIVRARIEAGLDRSVDDAFAWIDPVPLGAASIAQVHAAELHDGTSVVVKVRRPGLGRQFDRDIRGMALMAAGIHRFSEPLRMANLPSFVELFAQLVLGELDFRMEAANMVELGLASEEAGHEFVGFPRPIPGMVTRSVLVMERVSGVRYTDAEERYPGVVDGGRLMRLAIQGVLEHTLVYGVFHGDLHAGNVLVSPDGDLNLIDFGITGRLDPAQRASLVRFMVGFAQNDTARLVQSLSEFGAIPAGADLEDLRRQIDEAADELGVDRDDLVVTFDRLVETLSKIIRILAANGFRLPKELVLFFKNLLYLNGFAAALAPEANLLDEIDPIFGYFQGRYATEMQAILADALMPTA